MKAVTVQSLIGCLRLLEQEHPSHKNDFAFLLFGLAEQYLRFVFGRNWVNQILYGIHPRVSRQKRPGRYFLRAEIEAADDRLRGQERAIRLAEILFNLQAVEGIDGRVSALSDGPVEDTYAELEAGHYLRRRGVSFQFVTASGKRGLDYDGEILLPDGTKVNCEMKCKVESTQLSKASILSTLRYARRQLPRDELAIVFMKIPEAWLSQPEISAVSEQALSDFFRSTSRVLAVVMRWEEVLLQPDGAGAIVYKYRLERNAQVPRPPTAVSTLLNSLDYQGDSAWVSFRTVVQAYITASPFDFRKRGSL